MQRTKYKYNRKQGRNKWTHRQPWLSRRGRQKFLLSQVYTNCQRHLDFLVRPDKICIVHAILRRGSLLCLVELLGFFLSLCLIDHFSDPTSSHQVMVHLLAKDPLILSLTVEELWRHDFGFLNAIYLVNSNFKALRQLHQVGDESLIPIPIRQEDVFRRLCPLGWSNLNIELLTWHPDWTRIAFFACFCEVWVV